MEKIRQFITGLKDGFEGFAAMITGIMNFFLLAIAYFLGIGPVSVIGKIMGKHFLELGKEKKDSYWVKRDAGKQETEKYYRMF